MLTGGRRERGGGGTQSSNAVSVTNILNCSDYVHNSCSNLPAVILSREQQLQLCMCGITALLSVCVLQRNFIMEGGAMVLADGGVVCIDEFDKARLPRIHCVLSGNRVDVHGKRHV